jgi:hypothetical protein
MSRIVAELHNEVEDPDFLDRRQAGRRTGPGRRSDDVSEVCPVHKEALERRDEKCKSRKDQCDERYDALRDQNEKQDKCNEKIDGRLGKIESKLNVIIVLGLVFWPIIQIFIGHFIKRLWP